MTAADKMILEVAILRELFCNTGGSIAFGPDNMMLLSTVESSTPVSGKGVQYVNSGFAPLSDIP